MIAVGFSVSIVRTDSRKSVDEVSSELRRHPSGILVQSAGDEDSGDNQAKLLSMASRRRVIEASAKLRRDPSGSKLFQSSCGAVRQRISPMPSPKTPQEETAQTYKPYEPVFSDIKEESKEN